MSVGCRFAAVLYLLLLTSVVLSGCTSTAASHSGSTDTYDRFIEGASGIWRIAASATTPSPSGTAAPSVSLHFERSREPARELGTVCLTNETGSQMQLFVVAASEWDFLPDPLTKTAETPIFLLCSADRESRGELLSLGFVQTPVWQRLYVTSFGTKTSPISEPDIAAYQRGLTP